MTLYRRIWDSHVVAEEPGAPAVLYADLHLVHDGTSQAAFDVLRRRGLPVHRPDRTWAVADHCVPSAPNLRARPASTMLPVVPALLDAAREFGVTVYGPNDERQGIVHVIGPELGLTQPGMTIVCADSHTTTHGALGALAFGIGSTQAAHVLATQTLLQFPSRTLRLTIEGRPGPAATAKDIALHVIARFGVAAGAGHALEYVGSTVRGLSMEGRMTLCNMAIEMGARAALVGPDDVTFDYLAGRPFAPSGAAWEAAVGRWRSLASEPGAAFDRELSVDVTGLAPMVTYGTTPAMSVPVDGAIPAPASEAARRALAYMGLEAGRPLTQRKVDIVFIGSCTNSRIEDLRLAASVLRGRTVAPATKLLVVPGSQAVKRQAEREGLDRVFTGAGGEWREPGCSMCVAGNGDIALPGTTVASTSNRNFQGRQGPGARTLLMSPLTAAATAVEGVVADPTRYLV